MACGYVRGKGRADNTEKLHIIDIEKRACILCGRCSQCWPAAKHLLWLGLANSATHDAQGVLLDQLVTACFALASAPHCALGTFAVIHQTSRGKLDGT